MLKPALGSAGRTVLDGSCLSVGEEDGESGSIAGTGQTLSRYEALGGRPVLPSLRIQNRGWGRHGINATVPESTLSLKSPMLLCPTHRLQLNNQAPDHLTPITKRL